MLILSPRRQPRAGSTSGAAIVWIAAFLTLMAAIFVAEKNFKLRDDRPRFVQRHQHRGRASFQDLIFECRAFGIVLLEPFVRGDPLAKTLR